MNWEKQGNGVVVMTRQAGPIPKVETLVLVNGLMVLLRFNLFLNFIIMKTAKVLRQEIEGIAEAWHLGQVTGIRVSRTDILKNEDEYFMQATFTAWTGQYKYMF